MFHLLPKKKKFETLSRQRAVKHDLSQIPEFLHFEVGSMSNRAEADF